MRKTTGWISMGVLAAALAACSQPGSDTSQAPAQPLDTRPTETPAADPSVPVSSGNTPAAADIAAIAGLNASFDPARDPAADLETAKVEAQRGNKRIILDVGGEWCPWCHILDKFVEGDADVRRLRDANYVWMKVNYSDDNENTAFLSQYPEVKGYPHLFVLDAEGGLLHSQFTGELEQGKSYDKAKFMAFMKEWAPR